MINKLLQLKNLPVLLISIFIGTAAQLEAQTQWITNGINVASANTTLPHLSNVPDGNGGTFFAYENNSSGDIDIYVQWLDGSGNLRWGSSGISVCSSAGDQKYPSIASDGNGGAFIAWQDEISSKIYAQHLDSNGLPLWTSNGIVVCSTSGEQSQVKIVSDGQDGCILVWQDKRNGSETDLYAQRLNGAGNKVWDTNGMSVTTASGNQSKQIIIDDGSGGVFVVWEDWRNGYRNGYPNIDIYAQHLSSSGSQTWAANGTAVVSDTNGQFSPAIDTSGNKLIVTWSDSRTDNGDIYVQALDQNGAPLWTANGVPICVSSGTQNNSRIVHDGEDGAIITWADNRAGYDIYAQRIDENGNTLWSSNGIPVNQSGGYQYAPEIAPDGAGGSFIVWNDNRTGSDINLYAQHIEGSGNLLWSGDGLSIVSVDTTQQNQTVVSDGSGGIVILWQDSRNNKNDIYAQLVNDNVFFVKPSADTLWGGNNPQTIQWNLRSSQTNFDHFTLCLSSSPGDGFPTIIAQNVNPTQYSETWIPNSINTTTARIKIQARNSNDSLLCEYKSNEFKIDSDPPADFDLISPVNGATVDLNPTFQWESTTDNLSGVDHYELWIDGSPVESSLQTTNYTLTEQQKLTSGLHTWTVKAVDHAGLVREALHTWSLTASEDNTPPSPFHLLSPGNNTWTSSTNPLLTWEASSDTGTGLMKYQIYLDDEIAIDSIPPSITSTNEIPLTPGDHLWYVVAVDSFQNSRKSEETWTVRMDNVPPMPFSLSQPQDNKWINNTTPTFTWEATSDTSTGIGLFEYQLWCDGSLKVDHISGETSSVTLTEAQALDEGLHTWYVIAKDSLGNSRTSTNTFTVKIDTTSPQSFALMSPEDGSFITTLLPNFSWQSSTDERSGLLKYQLWIDGTLNRDNIAGTSSTPASPLSEGPHTWNIKAIDNAGNITTSSTFRLIADSTPPEPFDLISPLGNDTLHTDQPTFTWHSTNDLISGFDKFQFFIDGQIWKDNLSAQDTSVTITTSLPNGTHHWKVWAWDRAGNYRISDYLDFVISCNPPVITSPGTATATEDISFSYTATATDPDGDQVTFTFTDYPTWLTPAGNKISTPTEGKKDTSFTVIASDGVLKDTLVVNLTVIPVNDPPVITSPGTATATEDISFSYTATATDPDGDQVTFTFTDYPTWLTPAGNKISTCFTVIASDGVLKDTLTVILKITSVNDPPVITSPDTATAIEDSLFIYKATATDVDGPYLTIKFCNYPSWLKPSGPEIRGTPLNGTQDTTFMIIASDTFLSDTLLVKLKVKPVNDPPFFDYPFPQPVFNDIDTIRWELDLDDYASDPDDPDSLLNWSYTYLDTQKISVSINETTHVAIISGSHVYGTFRIAFTVTDPHNAFATDTLKITNLTTGVENQITGEIPKDFILYDNYPNPFNPTTTIRYGIPHPCYVRLNIYNLLGQKVSSLVNKKQREGTYEVLWNALGFPSGIYFYQIQAGTWQKIKRMILIK